jgi:hypothetical protein
VRELETTCEMDVLSFSWSHNNENSEASRRICIFALSYSIYLGVPHLGDLHLRGSHYDKMACAQAWHTIYIQQDNAKMQILVDDLEFIVAAQVEGWVIRLTCSP